MDASLNGHRVELEVEGKGKESKSPKKGRYEVETKIRMGIKELTN